MSKLYLSLELPEPSPEHIAAILRTIQPLPRSEWRVLVACDSGRQTRQLCDQVDEQLASSENGFKDLDGWQLGLPYFEVSSHSFRKNAHDEQEALGRAQDVGEGDFKVRLLDVVKKEDRGSQILVTMKLQVVEGPRRGDHFEDRVMVYPVDGARTEKVAQALNLAPGVLARNIEQAKDRQFWVRRRDTQRPDGTSRVANYYFPLDSPPPSTLSPLR
jgi:hypothetical protein